MLYNTNAAKGATRNPSRRTFLKIAPAAAVAAAAAEANASPAAVTPELAELIARYVARETRVREAEERMGEIEESEEYARRGTMTIREAVHNLTEYPDRVCDIPIRSNAQIDELFESVNAVFYAVTKIVKRPFNEIPPEERKMHMRRSDDYDRCRKLLEKRQAEKEEWLNTIGYCDLKKILYPEDGVERALHAQIIEFPCRSLADIIAKAEFAGEWIFRECDQEELFTLIKSMIPARLDNQPLHA